jgi:hypothetical protein
MKNPQNLDANASYVCKIGLKRETMYVYKVKLP